MFAAGLHAVLEGRRVVGGGANLAPVTPQNYGSHRQHADFTAINYISSERRRRRANSAAAEAAGVARFYTVKIPVYFHADSCNVDPSFIIPSTLRIQTYTYGTGSVKVWKIRHKKSANVRIFFTVYACSFKFRSAI